MKDFFKNEFDLIVSIGEDCACTSYLRRCNLQTASYPFDWLTNASFETKISLIVSDFKDFINIEDLKPLEKRAHNKNEERFDLYENTLNDLHFYHDFPIDIPLEKSFQDIKNKYQRRTERLFKQIKISDKILFVWLSHRKNTDLELIKKAYSTLADKFSDKQVFLLMIENSDIQEKYLLENNKILLIKQDTASDDKKHHYDATMGNKTNNLKIFKKLKLRMNIKEKFKKCIYKLCNLFASLLPSKNLRHSIKRNLNILFYHAKL